MFTSPLRCRLFLLSESLPVFIKYISLIFTMHTNLSGVALFTYQIWSSKPKLFVTVSNFNKMSIYWKMPFSSILLNHNNWFLSNCSPPFSPPQKKTVRLIERKIHSHAKLCNTKNWLYLPAELHLRSSEMKLHLQGDIREVNTSVVLVLRTQSLWFAISPD